MTLATFVIDSPTTFLVGVVFAFLLVDVEWDSRTFTLKGPFGWGFVFCSGFFGLALAGYAIAPDWMSMYFMEEGSPISFWGLAYLGVVLYAVPYAFGYAMGVGARRCSPLAVGGVLTLGLAVQVAVVLALWDRYFHVGTRSEYEAGTALLLPEHVELSQVFNLGTLALAVYLGICIWIARRRLRRARLDPTWKLHALSPARRRVVAAYARRLYPRGVGSRFSADEVDMGEAASLYLAQLPWMNRVGLGLALDLFQFWPNVVRRRPGRFTSLPPEEQDRVMENMERSRSPLILLVYSLGKMVVSLLHWDRPEVLEEVGALHECKGEHRPAWRYPR